MIAGTQRIVIAGAGGIGEAVALLLADQDDFAVEIAIGDQNLAAAEAVAHLLGQLDLRQGALRVHPFLLGPGEPDSEIRSHLERADLLLDCLPGGEAPRMARLALAHDLHYANLTEYVEETETIRQLARGASRGFVLQTGLAPGFVNVLGHRLYRRFVELHGPTGDKIERLRLRVGALPMLALAPSFYAFTWSPIGVATEYVEPATVVRDGRRTEVPSMTGIETLRLGSLVLEEAFTSGGVADLPEALGSVVETLDYKTLRHPGHWSWAQEVLDTAGPGTGNGNGDGKGDAASDQRIAHLLGAMQDQVPGVEDDQVIIFVAATGRDRRGHLRREEKLLVVEPQVVAGHRLRAIQLTTAAGLAEAARLLLDGRVGPGPVLQSEIDPGDFLTGAFVRRGYGDLGTLVDRSAPGG